MTSLPTRTIGVLAWLDGVAGLVAGVLAAALVMIEIIILFTGVVFRYVLNDPLIWTDELAEILFLWLVSFGAVVAYRRDEHMRMTIISGILPSSIQNILARISSLVILLVVGAIVIPGLGYMEQQQAVTTPALQIPGSWEIAGELFAFAMFLLSATYRLIRMATSLDLGVAIAVIAGIGVLFWSLEDVFSNIGNADLVIFFIGVAGLCILAGIPIAFSFGISTVTYLFYTSTVPLSVVISQMDQGMSSIELLAVPMFIVLGLLLEMTGIARALVNVLNALVGHKRGGLSYSLIGAMYLVSGISGSKAADQAAIAPVLLPEMKRRGTAPGELVAQLAASAAMSETIPPSLVLIIVGAVTGVSTQALFKGGLLPAAVAAAALIAVIAFRTRKDKAQGDKSPLRQTGRLFVVAIPALVLPVLIRYAVLAGITTATEVATVGVVYAALIGIFVYRQFEWRRLFPLLTETAALSGAILLIIGTASAMAWALTQAGFAQALTGVMTGLPGGRTGFMLASIVLFIILGSVLEGLPAMVLFGPLLFPIAQQLNINVVQYAIVAILAMGIGLFSPPFGVGFYQSSQIARTPSVDAITKIWPYMAALVGALLLVAGIPWLSTGRLF
jgi:tripartite ATP-independent transporter DctM subunit